MNMFHGGPLYPIIGAFITSVLYAGLFTFGFSRIIQRLYSFVSGSKIFKVQFYIYLLNVPPLVMVLTGVLYNESLLPLDVCLKMDQIYILIVSGYICYLQESRHTPIRGFVLIKDTILILVSLMLLLVLNSGTQDASLFVGVILTIYFFSLIIQAFTNELQPWLLLTLGIRQKNIYRAKFLLTQKSQPSNFLQIKDIISANEDKIEQQIQDFISVASGLKKSNQDLLILTNFAKLFIPIKKAYQIHQEQSKCHSEEQFISNWMQMSKDISNEFQYNQDQQQNEKNNSFNHSASTLMIKKTITTDSYFDEELLQKREQEQTIIYKVIKYVCYPLYWQSQIGGRIRYFLDYLIFFCLVVTMFVLANSISYLSEALPSNQNLISLLFAGILFYPVSLYFVRISQGNNDYDFIGIFMQGVINKFVVLSIALLLRGLFFQQIDFSGEATSMITLAVRMGTYLFLGAFLVWKRFAMRISNFKVFLGLFLVSELVKIVIENTVHYTV